MSETDLLLRRLSAAQRSVPQLQTAAGRELRNALGVWTPSHQTERLASEANRVLFPELVDLFHAVQPPRCRPFEMAAPLPTVISNVPKRLAALVVEFLVQNFNGGPVPVALSCCQRRDFGSMLSTELHLLKTIDLEIETYWRRVFWCCAADPLTYYRQAANPHTDWKRLSIELKLARLIEQQDPRYWELEALEDTIKKAAPFVRNLTIEQLMPYPSVELVEDYEAYQLRNVPDSLCHHGSLAVLGHLTNLSSLSLVFGVKNWTKPYRSRYSNVSLTDLEQLGVALRKLAGLKSFTLSRTRLSPEKLTVLVQSFERLPLATISLTSCNLGEGCGGVLGRFLSRFGPSLKHLDLSHNRLDARELDQLGPGLAVYQGAVDRLDLSYNPIGAAGVLILGGAIKGSPQLSELNFSGCPMGTEGSFLIIQLMSFHAPLRKVTMNCVPISPEGLAKLLQVLRETRHIEELQICECGLSEQAHAKVRKLLRINARRRLNAARGVKSPPEEERERGTLRSLASMYSLHQRVFPVSKGA